MAGSILSKNSRLVEAAESLAGTATPTSYHSASAEYRSFPGNIRVSTLALGAGSLRSAPTEEIERIVATSMERGINFMDTVMSDDIATPSIAKALRGRRDKMLLQIHLGAIYPRGSYVRTREMNAVQQGFVRELQKFGTDYADVGMIHYVDEERDANHIINGGILDYMQKQKQSGTIRYLGFSSHVPHICRKLLATGVFDTYMFSLNPAYDFEPHQGTLALSEERNSLYQLSQKQGVAISVMKTFGGGRLLNAATSPFGRAMTIPQCVQYALDRPGVVTCIAGISSMAELEQFWAYYSSSREERNYSFIGNLPRRDIVGACVYCNHCLPCPVGIDIGSVVKYTDLYKAGDRLAREHYLSLSKKAEDCIDCGVCERRCPFQVGIIARMKEAQRLFAIS